MTLLGAVFIPIALACFLWKPAWLLPLLVVASVFESGSVFSGAWGGFVFGLSPFFAVEICIAFRLLFSVCDRGKLLPSKETPARGIAILLITFLLWSVATAFLMPHFFAGMPVISVRERTDVDMVLGNFVPLQWSLSNLGQGIYLLLNVAAVFFGLLLVHSGQQAEALAKALRWAVFIVVTAGLLQQLAPWMGWSYPYAWLNNNPNNQFEIDPLDVQVYGFTRISSTFAEPMNSGSYLAAIASGLLASYLRGARGILALLALGSALAVLLLTTSTTGYAAFAAMLCPLLVYFNPLARRKVSTQPSFFQGWIVVTVSALWVAGLALFLVPGLSQALAPMTVEKSEGMSYLSRVASDQQSFAEFRDTYGLGIGLGSNRPSSLIMELLSTVGIVGTTLFALVLYRIARLFPGRGAPSALQMSFWSLAGLLVASMGVPDINRPALWALLIVVMVQLNHYRTAAVQPS